VSLAKSNKYLRNPEQRTAAIERNARASSNFEGASARALNAVSGKPIGKRDSHSASCNASPKKDASES